MVETLTAVAAVAALLLVLAGAAKIRDPAATSEALRLARLPDGSTAVRAVGAGEVIVGITALAAGGIAYGPLALAYVAFAVFAERQRRAGSSCGCFGVDEAPLTRLHVAVDAAAALGAGAATVLAAPSLHASLSGGAVLAAATVGALVVATFGVRHLLTSLPTLTALTDEVLAGDGVIEVAGA